MAQQASRSSVELYTNLFFKSKVIEEEAYVIRVLKNGMVVLIPKYGVESIVYTTNTDGTPLMKLNSENSELSTLDGKITIKLFDKVMVKVQVMDMDENSHRSKLVLTLLKPTLPSDLPTSQSQPKKKLKTGK
jgi:exosome complex exonuclease DIS3/RRP44